MTDYVIETENLTKKFDKTTVVDSVNLNVEKSKIYGLLGKNGAGKTTTMCMLLNLVNKSDGEIYLFGKNAKRDNHEIYSRIGSIIETPGFYSNLTGYENLKLFSKLQNVENKRDVIDSLKLVSLYGDKDKLFRNYSLGMKQRLGIALALLKSPDLLILDEPINGLDPVGIIEIRNLLKKLSSEFGLTILISSHILAEIEQLVDIIGIMDNGKLIEEITIDQLHNNINKYVQFKVSDIELAIEILNELGLFENKNFNYDDDFINLFTNHEDSGLINECFVKSGITVFSIEFIEENLEEYFINMVS